MYFLWSHRHWLYSRTIKASNRFHHVEIIPTFMIFKDKLIDITELRAFFLSPLLPFIFYSIPLFLRAKEKEGIKATKKCTEFRFIKLICRWLYKVDIIFMPRFIGQQDWFIDGYISHKYLSLLMAFL